MSWTVWDPRDAITRTTSAKIWIPPTESKRRSLFLCTVNYNRWYLSLSDRQPKNLFQVWIVVPFSLIVLSICYFINPAYIRLLFVYNLHTIGMNRHKKLFDVKIHLSRLTKLHYLSHRINILEKVHTISYTYLMAFIFDDWTDWTGSDMCSSIRTWEIPIYQTTLIPRLKLI